jgi:AcrR family transcriptional regulator
MEVNVKSTVRQQEIVDCARKIITSHGIENLTIREIAKDLNITDGALYRHFRSKKEIISLRIEDIEETLSNTVESAVKKDGDPIIKLENIFLSHISYAEQRKGVSFIAINEALSLKDKGLQRKMFRVIHRYIKRIRDILKEGVERGRFRKNININSSSIVFFGMVQSLVTLWALSGFKYSLARLRLDELLDIYKKGVMER